MDWFLTLIMGAIFIYLIYVLIIGKQNYWKDRGFPHVKSYPLVGSNLNVLLKRRTFVQNVSDIYYQLEGEEFGGYMQFETPTLMIRSLDLISKILVSDFVSFHDRGFTFNEDVNPLANNLSSLTGDYWRIMRYKITPAFTSGKLKTMFDSVKKNSEGLVEFIRKSGEVEVRDLMLRLNLNIIADVSFGLNVDNLDPNTENPFYECSTEFFKPSLLQLIKFILLMNTPKLARLLRIQTISRKVHNFFVNLINDTIEYRRKNNIRRQDYLQLLMDMQKEEETKGFSNMLGKNDMKSLIREKEGLEAEDNILLDQLQEVPQLTKPIFTNMAIAANSFMFLAAGSETSSSVLSYIIYELAVNQDVQQKLKNEADSVLSNGTFDYAAVKKMTYLEKSINEVMRLHTPGGILLRAANTDYTIPGTNKIIEKGTLIVIPTSAIHMDSKYFPDPEVFNPDRFHEMKSISRIFLPFGDGPRICIAMKFAMLEMKIVTAALLSSYDIILSEKTKLPIQYAKDSFGDHVVGGIWVKFVPRNK